MGTEKESLLIMQWKEIARQRRDENAEIYKRINALEKQLKQNGSSYPPNIIADLLSNQYERVCRIETIGSGYAAQEYLVLYKKYATQKQIQYKRHEVADYIAIYCDAAASDKTYKMEYRTDCGEWLPLPDNIEDIYNIITKQ